MKPSEIPIGSQWIDAWQNVIRVDRITDHTGTGAKVFATDMMLDLPCPHPFALDMFEPTDRKGSGRRQMGFQMISRSGIAPQAMR